MKATILLILAIGLLLFSTNLNADTTGTIRYEPETVIKSVGDQWSMNIIFDGTLYAAPDTAHLMYYLIGFRYNPSVVSIKNVVFGNWWLNDWDSASPIFTTRASTDFEFLELSTSGGQYTPIDKTFSNEIFATIEFEAIGIGSITFLNEESQLGGFWNIESLIYDFSDIGHSAKITVLSPEEDDDYDGIVNAYDNCPLDANSDQEDYDEDGVGDICDEDDDGDGIFDEYDYCSGTPLEVYIDSFGCSGEQLVDQACPCDLEWENHGEYVRCVVYNAEDQFSDGLITQKEKNAILSQRAKGDCGKKK